MVGLGWGLAQQAAIFHAEIDHPRLDLDHPKHGKLWVMSWAADVLLKVPKKSAEHHQEDSSWSSINENGHVDLRK
jgi:hypothetical protein